MKKWPCRLHLGTNAFDKLTKSESTEEDCMTSSKNTGLSQSSPRTETARNYSTWAEFLPGFSPQSSALEPHPVSHFLQSYGKTARFVISLWKFANDTSLAKQMTQLKKSKQFQRALIISVWVRSEMVQMGHGFSPKKSKERHAIFRNPGYLYNIKGKVLRSKKCL